MIRINLLQSNYYIKPSYYPQCVANLFMQFIEARPRARIGPPLMSFQSRIDNYSAETFEGLSKLSDPSNSIAFKFNTATAR